MSEPGDLLREAPSAREAPEIIYLPPPANDPTPSTPGAQRKNGRAVSPKPGSQISRRRTVKDPRSARFDVRCTPDFHAKVIADAEAAGLSLSAFVCAKLGEEPSPRSPRRKRPDRDWALLAQMLAALGRSGNNLNQLLRRVNSYDFRGHPELLEMAEAMKTAHAAHLKLVEAILAELKV